MNFEYLTKKETLGILIGCILSMVFLLNGLLGQNLFGMQLVAMPISLSWGSLGASVFCFITGYCLLKESQS
ncbi:hypothetical protein [Saccharobesus litoralis]|uniref:hypothetical protein n=1 Tax=Saccharobesus litoralis TaxID=2172099 RepID=UPI00131ED710|nr:hypothetical protein [Saccharobesus litoralis]